ncbi:MAG: hypothetical protein ABEI74_01660 [Candidatus Pacearchaeota archaeon]
MKVNVEPQEKSELVKELMGDIDAEPGSFGEKITKVAPIICDSKRDAKEHWQDIHDSLILDAIDTYKNLNNKFLNDFERQMEAMVYHAVRNGPENKDKSFGIYLGENGYIITYNDGSDFFKFPQNKSEFESKYFNHLSECERWERSYKILGNGLDKLCPCSEFAVENQSGTLYVYEDRRNRED